MTSKNSSEKFSLIPPIVARRSSYFGIIKSCSEIAALLGAPPGSFPDPWSEDLYNVILDFRYDPNTGAAPAVTRVVEPF